MKNNVTIYFKGKLEEQSYCEDDEVLFLIKENKDSIILLKHIKEAIDEYGNCVNVRYWIDDEPIKDVDSATEEFLLGLYSNERIKAEFHMVYSEITGYLYTDEYFVVGGHDVLDELTTYLGKYLLLEIEFISK